MPLISLQGIDAALANLDFNAGTLKSQLTRIIRSAFTSEESLREISALPAEEIIRQLWKVDQPEEIRPKKKNLSSLKSAINKDLKELARQGKNPEGLIISRDNVFSISEEQKNDILEKIGLTSVIDTPELLSGFRALLDRARQGSHQQETIAALLREFDQFREQITGVAGGEAQAPPASSGLTAAVAAPASAGEADSCGAADSSLAEIAGHESAATGAGQQAPGGAGEGRFEGDGTAAIRTKGMITNPPPGSTGEAQIAVTAGGARPAVLGGEGASSGLAEVAGGQSAGERGFGGTGKESAGRESDRDGQAQISEPALAEAELLGKEPGSDAPSEIVEEVLVAEEAGTSEAPLYDAETEIAEQTLAEAETELLEEEPGSEEEPELVEEVLAEEADEAAEESSLEAESEIIEEPIPEETAEIIDWQNVLADATEPLAAETDALSRHGKGDWLEPVPVDADSAAQAEAAGGLLPDQQGSGAMGAETAQEPAQEEQTGILAADLPGQEPELLIEAPASEEEPELVEEVLIEEEGIDPEPIPEEEAEVIGQESALVEEAAADEQAPAEEESEIIDEALVIDEQPAPVDDTLTVEEAEDEAEPIFETPVSEEEPELVEEVLAEEEDGGIDPEPILEEEAEVVGQEPALVEEAAAQEQGPSAPGDMPLTEGGGADQRLALSHYIEPEEALAAPAETLVEAHDEYIAQILDRFMPKFIRIPAGYYLTGRARPQMNERQSKKIMLQNFYIGQLPVTNDLFDFFVREKGYETDAEKAGYGMVYTGRISTRIDAQTGRHIVSISHGTQSRRVQGANWRHPQGPDSSLENKANHPVVQVSRHDALAFAAWAGKRLPSEDEWEAAARGPQGFLFPWGNEWQAGLANIESACIGDTSPVTRYGKPSMSPFGVYDLLGNVFEWTSTTVRPDQPSTGNAPLILVLKGGCWTSKTGITAASRLREGDTWSNIIGFRCAV